MEAQSGLMWTFFLTTDFLRMEAGSLNPLTATIPVAEPILDDPRQQLVGMTAIRFLLLE